MPVDLKLVKQELAIFRKDYTKYPRLQVLSLDTVPAPGINALTFKGVVHGESGTDYLSYVQFFDILYKDTPETPEYTETTTVNGKLKFYKKPNIKYNLVKLKCSCFTADTLIPLANGTSVPIKDLVGKREFFVYSFDKTTNKIVIGKGYNCGIKEKSAKTIKVTFDNGNSINCTPDHKFLLKSGEWVEAKDIKPDMSLQAVYRKTSSENPKMLGYEQVLQDTGWEETHRLADKYNLDSNIYLKSRGNIRHHVNFNKRDNDPTNIQRMGYLEHYKTHHEHMVGENNPMYNPASKAKRNKTCLERGLNLKVSERMKLNNPMFNPESRNKAISTQRANGRFTTEAMTKMAAARTPESFKAIGESSRARVKLGTNAGLNAMIKITKDRCLSGCHHTQTKEFSDNTRRHQLMLSKEGNHIFQDPLVRANASIRSREYMSKSENQDIRIKARAIASLKAHILEYGSLVRDKFKSPGTGYPGLLAIERRFNLDSLIKEATNHKVISIEESESADVYCFTVDKYHNFMIDVDNGSSDSSGVIVHNCDDSRFRFEKQLYDNQGLIGNWRRYSRVTPPPPKGYPYANPKNVMGYCKHIHSLLVSLKASNRIDD